MHAVDSNLDHLYPDFRKKLEKVLKEAPGGPWRVVEGYRSQARQTWLYAAGRTRPGPIVTWMKNPLNHGAGLAADVIPAAGYGAPRSTWEALRKVYLTAGLENPAWKHHDLGHIQWPSSDQQTHQEAEDWVKAGFPAVEAYDEVPLILRGETLPFKGHLDSGTTWAPLRALAQEIELVIHSIRDGKAFLIKDGEGPASGVPIRIIAGKGWSPVRQVVSVAGLIVQMTVRGVEIDG